MSTHQECNICTRNISKKSFVKCPYCNFESCNSCCSKFLLSIDDNRPRCMNTECKKIWSFDFIYKNFSNTFYNKTYRDRLATILQEREMSLLPGTQELVTRRINQEKNNKRIVQLMEENRKLLMQVSINKHTINTLRYGGNYETRPQEETTERKKFIRACPVKDCRGFLSTSWKCELCETYTCKDCGEIKKEKNDDGHKCNPDLVATMKLLNNDSKPCPSCSAVIYKISGCDQMWCTVCRTPFSWNTGKIETGVVHNPHYYDMMRKLNGGVAPRNPGDMRCGGLPDLLTLSSVISAYSSKSNNRYTIYGVHRLVNHINIVEIPYHPVIMDDGNHSDLRVDYLMNKIDKKEWMAKLKTRLKKHEKDIEINQILNTFNTCTVDVLNDLVNEYRNDIYLTYTKEEKNKRIEKFYNDLKAIREYTNTALQDIGERFGHIYPVIDDKWGYWRSIRDYNRNAGYEQSAAAY